jgi:inhibitor of cysteine peptidase
MKTDNHRRILNHTLNLNWLLPGCRGAALLAALALLPGSGLGADASRVTTNPGRQFSITLDSNPTTGYQWKLAKPVTGTCVALVTNEFVRPKSKLTGAPGKEVWKFKALTSGEAEIELQYVRPWDNGVEPARKTNLTVVVTTRERAK